MASKSQVRLIYVEMSPYYFPVLSLESSLKLVSHSQNKETGRQLGCHCFQWSQCDWEPNKSMFDKSLLFWFAQEFTVVNRCKVQNR